ncbi:hypothetical protein GW17_00043916 [Ensete ventricosum]|nr:hypothetical protein GW17_00043916 [Ensete ventricosum]RZS03713.1 hypothetical protein BHM03_00033930 [Ensete ventricosum]
MILYGKRAISSNLSLQSVYIVARSNLSLPTALIVASVEVNTTSSRLSLHTATVLLDNSHALRCPIFPLLQPHPCCNQLHLQPRSRTAAAADIAVIQLAELKLGSEGISTEQEDVEVSTLEKFAKVLRVVIKKVVHNRDCAGRGIKAQHPDNGASILVKGMIRTVEELDCFSALIRLREPGKLEDKTDSANPTQESVIGELKQPGGSEFNYSTIAVKSSWEPKGMLQPKRKIEDSAKGVEMQRL